MNEGYSDLYWCLLEVPAWKLTKRNGQYLIGRFSTIGWINGKIANACFILEKHNIEVLNG